MSSCWGKRPGSESSTQKGSKKAFSWGKNKTWRTDYCIPTKEKLQEGGDTGVQKKGKRWPLESFLKGTPTGDSIGGTGEGA